MQRFTPKVIIWRPISGQDKGWLDRRFEESEISNAIRNLGKNKVPDGFTIEFFSKFWQHWKGETMRFFAEFYRKCHVNACIKENFIGLVPKKSVSPLLYGRSWLWFS